MQMLARHFECFPPDLERCRDVAALIRQLGEVTFAARFASTNSYQCDSDLDQQIAERLLALHGVAAAELEMPGVEKNSTSRSGSPSRPLSSK